MNGLGSLWEKTMCITRRSKFPNFFHLLQDLLQVLTNNIPSIFLVLFTGVETNNFHVSP